MPLVIPIPIPLMNLPTYNMDTALFDKAINSHPVAYGRVAKAMADLLPNHSAQRPEIRDPRGFEITPNAAIQEACS